MNKKITLNFISRKVFILSALFFIIVLTNCKKDGELIPEFDKGNVSVLFTDTVSIITNLEREDSIRTDFAAFNLLGIYNDPVFGPTSSSIYSQIALNGLNVDFGNSPVLDSIVLTLKYADIYGDTTTPMQIDVFELTEAMDVNTEYYSNDILSFNSVPLASKTFTPNLSDSVFILFDSSMVTPHLRINLGNTFGQTILNESGGPNLENNDAFIQFIKGLYITTQESVLNTSLSAGSGSIISFDLNSSISTVTIYYNDTSSYEFIVNAESAKYNKFDHNYSGTDIEAQLAGGGNATVSYIQTLAGVKTKVEIPYIKNLADSGNIAINKAELVIKLEDNSDDVFTPISTFSLVGISSSGETVFLPDFFEGISHYGGIFDEVSKTYTFNISRHVHDLIYNTSADHGMYIIASGSAISANRSIIGTEESITAKMTLNITYSKL